VARRRTNRSGLSLSLVAAALAVAYAVIIGFGYSPKLGLDLSGGTSLTLQPKVLGDGKKPTQEALDKAVDIIRLRIDSFGVGEAEVRKQGPYIIVEVPGSDREGVINRVGTTAQLFFREVAESRTDESLVPAPVLASASAARASASAAAGRSPAAAGASTVPAVPAGSSAPVIVPASPTATGVSANPAAPATTARPRPQPFADPSQSPLASTPASPEPSPASTSPLPAALTGAAATPAAPGSAGASVPAAAVPPVSDADKGEANARARFAALRCGDPKQTNEGANDTPEHWSVGCDRKGTRSFTKYLLKPAVAKGTDVKGAQADIVTNSAGNTQFTTNDWRVVLQFKNSNFEKLTTITANNGSQGTCPGATQPSTCQTAIVLDGVVESAPQNATAIAGDAEITGNFTQKEAETLATSLKYGALPLSFSDNAQAETISPTLGKDSLHAGLLAGGIGLLIVVAYCFLYYRALGIVTILSLLVSGAMVYATIVLLGASVGLTLSLASIAGFIVAVGITADSFVVFYERLKDEVRDGRTLRSAVEVGWRSARRTIIAADSVSILAAVLLYIVSIGSVKGFAFTLGISTLLDLVTVFLFTKPIVTLLVRRPLFSTSRWSGLSATAGPPQAPLRRRPGARPGEPGGPSTVTPAGGTP
jgi:preprotein translocase subunit SecD